MIFSRDWAFCVRHILGHCCFLSCEAVLVRGVTVSTAGRYLRALPRLPRIFELCQPQPWIMRMSAKTRRQSVGLQGSRRPEDFAPDDGLAKCGGGFDFERGFAGTWWGWFCLGNDRAQLGHGDRSGCKDRCWLVCRCWYFRWGGLRCGFFGDGDTKCLEESAHFLLGSWFAGFGSWDGGGRLRFEVGVYLRLPAGTLRFKTTLLPAFSGLLDKPVDEADRSDNEEQDELFHRGIRPGWMRPAWLWSHAWLCRTGCFSGACSP